MAERRDYLSRVGKATKRSFVVRLARLLRGDTLRSLAAVTVICLIVSFGGLALTWLVYRERYGLGFIDYLRVMVF